MLRRHFMTGEEIPDFIITYYAPKHVPFFGGIIDKNIKCQTNPINMFPENLIFDIVLDEWKDGIGSWGIKLINSDEQICYFSPYYYQDTDVSYIGDVMCLINFKPNQITTLVDNRDIITDIIIPEGIVYVNGSISFSNMDRTLQNVTLPNSLKYISNYPLLGLTQLKTITIPENVICIKNAVTQINDTDGDNGHRILENVIIKPVNPPEVLGDRFATPFGSIDNSRDINPNLKFRVYADCIDKYKNDEIWGQYSDLYDTINNAIVYYLEDGSRKIYEQNDVITNTSSIYGEIKNATSIYLPNSVTTLSLTYYSKLKEFTIPDGITTLLRGSLYYCTNLEKLTINDNIINAEHDSIEYCNNINTIFFNNNSISLFSIIANSNNNLKCVVIGDNVTLLLIASFTSLSNLQEVIIPNTITIIPSSCFSNCTSLQTIQIPNSVTSIGHSAFAGCSSLTSITIPNSVTNIEDRAFNGCSSLTEIVIPNSVTSIEASAFSRCSSLTSITFNGTKAQWVMVNLGTDWNNGVPATVVHCTDGDIKI